jgi:hypothetical protein
MISPLPPAAVFILGALLIPFFKGASAARRDAGPAGSGVYQSDSSAFR